MLAAVWRLFSPPVFPDDEDKTIAATMAHYGILFGLTASVVQLPVLLAAGDSAVRSLLLTLSILAGLLINFRFLRQGHVRGASAAFIVFGWLVLAGANFTAGGVKAPGSRSTSSS